MKKQQAHAVCVYLQLIGKMYTQTIYSVSSQAGLGCAQQACIQVELNSCLSQNADCLDRHVSTLKTCLSQEAA